MAVFSHLVRFESEEDGSSYFADLGPNTDGPPAPGTKLEAFSSLENLGSRTDQKTVTLRRVRRPPAK